MDGGDGRGVHADGISPHGLLHVFLEHYGVLLSLLYVLGVFADAFVVADMRGVCSAEAAVEGALPGLRRLLGERAVGAEGHFGGIEGASLAYSAGKRSVYNLLAT